MNLQEFIDTFIQKGTVDVYLNHMSNYQGTIRKNESGIKLAFSLGNYNELKDCSVTSVFADLENDLPVLVLILSE